MYIIVDDFKKVIYIGKKRISLTKMEFSLYFILLNNRNRTIDSSTVISKVWPERKGVISQNNLSQLAFKLKKKMNASGLTIKIKSSILSGCELSCERKLIVFTVKHRISSKLIMALL